MENEKLKITKEIINSQLDEFIKIVYGEENNFSFRPNQKETMVDLIYNTLEGDQINQIIEAPTGTGKSIINLLSSTFLAHYYNKSSYILCSDLFLFSQYEDAIKSNPYFDEKIAYIKGQYGNYKCNMNGEDFRSGLCRVQKASWSDILKPFTKEFKGREAETPYPCALKCEYCKQKVKIRTAKVVVTTYQNLLYCYLFWDLDQFSGEARAENLKLAKITYPYNLRPKSLCFCDEAHNIPEIVQAHFTPQFKLSNFENHAELYNWARGRDLRASYGHATWDSDDLRKEFPAQKDLYEKYINFWEIISKKSIKHQELYGVLNKYLADYFWQIKFCELAIREEIGAKLAQKIKLTPEEYNILNECNIYAEFFCKFSDVMQALGVVGAKFLLKQYGEPSDDEEPYIEIHCMREDYLCSHFFLNYHKRRIFTSATIGDKSQFDKNLGIAPTGFYGSSMVQIPSYFDFSKSPIQFIPKYSMSFRNKKDSLPYLAHYINEICSKLYPNSRGLIQTGSYENMKKFMEMCSPEITKRFIYYKNSKDKKLAIEKYKNIKNAILIGPSLNEGIDLPHDLCRFIIIGKVPYMNIEDEFVQEKSKLFPKWYNSQASIEIIQGIGRGVRAQGDFCETFILDSCFAGLYSRTKNQYPKEIRERLNFIDFVTKLFKRKAA